jgi:hypothetical protein
MPAAYVCRNFMKKYLLCGVSVALLAGASSLAPGMQAATLTVTNTGDSGPGSLRDAIVVSSRGDEIVFDPSLAGRPIILTTGELLIDDELTIRGLGQEQTILDGNATSRVFRITEGASVILSDLTVRNGWSKECLADHRTRSEGGGIYNAGLLELDRILVTQNRVDHRESHCDESYDSPESISGGGLYNEGTLVLSQSALDANAGLGVYSYGGGLYNAGVAMLTDSSVSRNTGYWDRYAGLQGAGIYNAPSGTVTLLRCAVNGNVPAKAIENAGYLTVTSSTIAGNGFWRGGGLLNFGLATITETAIIANWSGVGSDAGGISNRGTLTLERSLVAGGSGEYGGGIVNGGVVRLINSTVSGNEGYWLAGGISNTGTAMLVGTTITGNVTGHTYAGLFSGDSGRIGGTIVAGNYNFNDPGQSDCGGSPTSLGHNLVGLIPGCGGVLDGVNGDVTGVDWTHVLENGGSPYGRPRVNLADNGGPTPTVALLPGSPALDAIPASSCLDADGNPLLTDQRGVARPQGPACDTGAFELSPPRGTGFWGHQCSGRGYSQLTSAQMQTLFDQVAVASPAFPECAPVGCGTLLLPTPQNDMRLKARRSLLGFWLNVITGRVTRGRPIDLPALTSAPTAGDALAEVEMTVCDPNASRGDLGTAKEIAEAINNQGEDMELVSVESSATLQPGVIRFFTLAVVNMSPDVRSYDLTTSGTWPISLSPARINGLAPDQIAPVTATLFVPGGSSGQTGEVHVTAADTNSAAPLTRTVTIRILIGAPADPIGGGKNRHPPKR